MGRAFPQPGLEGSATARRATRVYIILSEFWQPLDFEFAAYQRRRCMAPMDRHCAQTTDDREVPLGVMSPILSTRPI